MKEKIIKNTFINGSFDVLGKLLELFVLPVIVCLLGTSRYGIFALAVSFVLESNVFEFGIGAYVTKKIAELRAQSGDMRKIKNVVRTMLSFNMIIGIITGVILLVFNYFMFAHFFHIPSEQIASANLLLSLLIIYLMLKMGTAIFPRILQGCEEFLLLQRAFVSEKVSRLLLMLLFLKMGFGLVGIGYAYILGILVGTVLQIISVRRTCPEALCLVPSIDWKTLKQSFSFSVSLFIGKIAAIFLYKANIWIIAYMLNLQMVTYYQVALKLWQVPGVLLGYINSTVLPVTSRLEIIDKERLQSLFKKGTYYDIFLIVPVLVIMFVSSRQIMYVWMGPGYEISAGLLRLLIVITAIHPILVEFGKNMMIGLNRYKYILKYNLIGSMLALLCSIFLIGKIGVFGVGWGMIVGSLFITYFYINYFLKTFSLKTLTLFNEVIWKPLLFLAIFSVAFLCISSLFDQPSAISLIAVSTISLIIFGCAFLALGVKKDDQTLIYDFIKSIHLKAKLK